MVTKNYKSRMAPLFKVNPKLTLEEAKEVIDISKASFYRIKAELLTEEFMKKYGKKPEYKTGLKTIETKITPELIRETKYKIEQKQKANQYTPQCPHCVGEFVSHFRDFVGYVDEKGKQHEGIAFPPPINEKGIYLGVLDYELRAAADLFLYKNIMKQWPRGHGKTYVATWYIEWDMKYRGARWLYLSETKIMMTVASWLHKWAKKEGTIVASLKGARQNTYKGFELNNGARVEIYKYMSEETTGQHNWKLMFDDVLKRNWQNKPSDELRAEHQWQYNIKFIRRTQLVIWGTRKFEGDILQHFQDTIPELKIEKLSPFIKCIHDNLNPQGTYNPCDTCQDKALLAPTLTSYKKLMEQMEEDYESWYSEMMQDPHPRAGGMCEEDDIRWVNTIPHWKNGNIKMVGIGVDCAWTESETSDNTGIVSMVMWSKRIDNRNKVRRFLILKSDVRKMPIQNVRDKKKGTVRMGIMETIQQHYDYLRRHYPNHTPLVAIERNSGGIVIIDTARRDLQKWRWAKRIVEDPSPGYRNKRKLNPDTPIKLGVTHNKEKVSRIFAELQEPIKRGQVEFFEPLMFGSELVEEVVTFPKCKHDDGVDALGMIKDELNRRYGVISIKERAELAKQSSYTKSMKAADERFESMKWGGSRGSGSLF